MFDDLDHGGIGYDSGIQQMLVAADVVEIQPDEQDSYADEDDAHGMTTENGVESFLADRAQHGDSGCWIFDFGFVEFRGRGRPMVVEGVGHGLGCGVAVQFCLFQMVAETGNHHGDTTKTENTASADEN